VFKKIKEIVANVGYCTIVVSEGLMNLEGQLLSSLGSADAFGNVQMGGVASYLARKIQDKLKLK